jgi:hypothetical protein
MASDKMERANRLELSARNPEGVDSEFEVASASVPDAQITAQARRELVKLAKVWPTIRIYELRIQTERFGGWHTTQVEHLEWARRIPTSLLIL